MGKKVLIVGSGGREHALAWKISQSPHVDAIYVAPGNGGTETDPKTKNEPIEVTDIDGLADFARKEGINLTIVGPETPLAFGIVDRFKDEGLTIFGPTEKAAQLESSKTFAKQFMSDNDIPTAGFRVFSNHKRALEFVERTDVPVVIKADGLASGKGVFVCKTIAEAQDALEKIFIFQIFGDAGDKVVIEEFLEGSELSIHLFCDGKTATIMPSSQDHKPIYNGDKGPNTGGMGAYAPVPWAKNDTDFINEIYEKTVRPTIDGLLDLDIPFVGCLYVGLIITKTGPKVLEYNVRFGDPETQPLMMLLETDLIDIIEACISGELDRINISWSDSYAVCVVLASEGYPGKLATHKKIHNIKLLGIDIEIFHAATKIINGQFFTSGGRVAGVTSLNKDINEAIKRAYTASNIVSFEGIQYRTDIGFKAHTIPRYLL